MGKTFTESLKSVRIRSNARRPHRVPNKQRKNEPNFEESLGELERIVNELESGDLGLGDALHAYEEGIKHLKRCHDLLEKAERRIELLSGVDADGNSVAAPFDEHATDDLTEKASKRGRKRTAGTQSRPPDRDAADPPNVDDPESLF